MIYWLAWELKVPNFFGGTGLDQDMLTKSWEGLKGDVQKDSHGPPHPIEAASDIFRDSNMGVGLGNRIGPMSLGVPEHPIEGYLHSLLPKK